MRAKKIMEQNNGNALLPIFNKIEKCLKISFIILLLVLLISQTLLYNKIGNKFLNPVYQMEGKLFAEKAKEPIYNIICIYGEIPEYEDVWVIKNGVPISQIIKGVSVYVHVFDGDIIEIDATHASGIPHEIFVKNIFSGMFPKGFPEKIMLKNKLYRLPPFYL